MQKNQKQKEVLKKKEQLDKVSKTLKTEFIGLDLVIDKVINAISPWYFFPELQDKPLVVNLWGLTGVGKTSLVNRIVQLIGYEDKYTNFDMSQGLNNSYYSSLNNIYQHNNGKPFILVLDEMQKIRTINEKNEEIKEMNSAIVWQILGSGIFQVSLQDLYWRYNNNVDDLFDLINKLTYLANKGVQANNGIVANKVDYYIEKMDLNIKEMKKYEDTNNCSIPFVPESCLEDIYQASKEKFNNTYELKESLMKLNHQESINFLLDILSFAKAPKSVDCTKALIFVLGNIDEAYTMSDDFSPDMQADEFHEKSLKITLPIIKEALKARFRNEQIARLGNIHIIYPAFNNDSYKKIIEMELNKIKEKVFSLHSLELNFDETIKEMIYKEGVYPTQGIRPILSTVHKLVKTHLGNILCHLFMINTKCSSIFLKLDKNNLIIDFYNNTTLIDSIAIVQDLELEKLRENKADNKQAITAVHEAGHAIMIISLLKTIPKVLFSTTVDENVFGFVYTDFKSKFSSKKEINSILAYCLGGYVAEKMVFGANKITTGSDDDISKATSYICQMIKRSGLGSKVGCYMPKHDGDNGVFKYLEELDREGEAFIKEAIKLAEKTLHSQQKLFFKVADYLSENRQLNKQQLTEFIKEFGKNIDIENLIAEIDTSDYRAVLKKKVSSLLTA